MIGTSSLEHDGKVIGFTTVTGTVRGRSKTVLGNLEEGRSAQQVGPIVLPGTPSKIVHSTKQEFWLQAPSQPDVPVQLSGPDIPVLDGQQLGVVFARSKDRAEQVVLVVNKSANRIWRTQTTEAFLKDFKLIPRDLRAYDWVITVLAIFSIPLSNEFLNSSKYSWIFLIVYHVVFVVVRNYLVRRPALQVAEAHLNKLSDLIMQEPTTL